jgi:hypothetical protein
MHRELNTCQTLMTNLAEQLTEPSSGDVVFVGVGSRKLHAYKHILAASSDYFKAS